MVLHPPNNCRTTGKCNVYGSVSICCYLFIIVGQTEDYSERLIEYAAQVLDCGTLHCYSVRSV
jgi:hypothetical protein